MYKTRAHIFIPSIGLCITPQDLSLPASLVILRMRSFAAFTTFIVFAFLTLISALPSGASSQDINVCYLHFLDDTILTMPKISAEHSLRGGGNQGIRDCINSANVQIELLIKNLSKSCLILLHRTNCSFIVAIKIDEDDVSVVLPVAIKVMDEVKVVLETTKQNIMVILKDDLSDALCFNGVTVGASVVVNLLTTLCKVSFCLLVLCEFKF